MPEPTDGSNMSGGGEEAPAERVGGGMTTEERNAAQARVREEWGEEDPRDEEDVIDPRIYDEEDDEEDVD